MKNENEKLILSIIKYFPTFFIILISITISIVLYKEHKMNIINEKEFIQKQFIKESKEEIKALIDTTHKLIKDIKNDNEKKLKSELKNQVQNSYTIAKTIYNNYKSTKTKEEITQLIKSSLKGMRFNNGRGYFFIFKRDGKAILNSEFPHLEGKNLWNYKDSKGTLLLQEMEKILKTKNETFYEWYWQKPNQLNKNYKKIGFFKKFEFYDWFIGTGEYYDDFENISKQNILNYIQKIRYKNDRYIFITDENGKILINKYPNLVGENVKVFKGDFQKKEFDDIKRLKEGYFLNYELDENTILHNEKIKTSYIKLLEDWKWVLGTGFNLKYVNQIISEKNEMLEKKYNSYLTNFIMISIMVISILLVFSILFSNYLKKVFYKYKSELQEKHKTLLKAQKTAHIGDWKLNLNTREAYWSDEIMNIFGIEKPPEKVGPMFLKKIMHKDDWKCFETSMNDTIKNDKEHACIYRIIRPIDKRLIWIDCRGKKSHSGNHIYGTIQDITKRKELEEEKKYNESLLYQQSKMAAMGEMLENIAHQWRQPLSLITTAATGAKVQNNLGLLNKNNINSYFDTINNTAQHLSQTIEDFRTYFNPKENKISNFYIEDTIEKTLSLIDSEFKTKDIQIIKNIEKINIESLENELIQSLLNILKNAKDELIKIQRKNKIILINAFKSQNDLIIEVQDNGDGIPNKILNRVFEPYFTTKHQSQGTGIGLYMTREIIVKLLKGEISVQNEEFKYKNKSYEGAKFTIKLPIN